MKFMLGLKYETCMQPDTDISLRSPPCETYRSFVYVKFNPKDALSENVAICRG